MPVAAQACLKVVAVWKGGVVFTGLLIEGYVQQSKDDNTRNNNVKPSTKMKENIQSYK